MVTQKVRVVNPGLSDEQARTVLGTLGLTGAKAVRKVGLLSGSQFPYPIRNYFEITVRNFQGAKKLELRWQVSC